MHLKLASRMPIALIEALVSSRITKRVLAELHSGADISIGTSVKLPLLARDARGQDLIEYAVIAAFVALVALVGATTLGNSLSSLYHSTTHNVDHGANFTSNSSASTSGGNCEKDTKDSTAGTPTPTSTGTTASTNGSGCK